VPSNDWWREGVIYQVYPRSFQDSNGDGVGDRPGVISQLEYLQWLGIDAIWLTPITVSPDKDMGYVANYCNIQPAFGTLDDVDELIREAGKRNIKVATRSRDGQRVSGNLVLEPWQGAICSSASI
jgi:glycosidase